MTGLPRRRTDPLPPPPGSFEAVLARAGVRRRRRALGVSSAVAAVLVVTVAGVGLAQSSPHDGLPGLPATTGATLPGPSHQPPADSPDDRRSAAPGRQSGPDGTPGGPAAASWLRGRAVDGDGQGIAGLLVQPGRPGRAAYDSDGQVAAVTDDHGNYRIGCPHAPVLLATWRVNQPVTGGVTGGPWAATFVGGGETGLPACDGPRTSTTVGPGATVTGRVVDTGPCLPGDSYNVWLWLDGDRGRTVRLAGLASGGSFAFSGLPAGSHTLGLRGQTATVVASAGEETTADVAYACPGGSPSPTPDSSDGSGLVGQG